MSFRLIKFQDYQAAQQHARNVGLDCRMLSEAISNLSNLSKVEIRNFASEYEGGRVRDNTAWRSYGWKNFEDATGIPLLVCPHLREHMPIAPVFQKVLAAATECSKLESFVLHTRSHGRSWEPPGVSGTTLWVPSTDDTKYRKALLHLKTLMLVLSNLPHSDRTPLVDAFGRFASYTPNLQHLRLNWSESTDHTDKLDDLFSDLAQKLPLLNCFELGMTPISSQALARLQDLKSVQELTFHRVSLQDLSGGASLGWIQVLRMLVKTMPKLRSINLRLLGLYCTDFRGSAWRARVCFKESPDTVVHTIPGPGLTATVMVSDKHHHDLSAAMEETLLQMVVDDEEFRKARGWYSDEEDVDVDNLATSDYGSPSEGFSDDEDSLEQDPLAEYVDDPAPLLPSPAPAAELDQDEDMQVL